MKRKFKIIFAIVAVMAMLFAFAIVSSASVYINTEGFEIGVESTLTSYSHTNKDESFESSCDEIFGYYTLSSTDSGSLCYGLINIEFWDAQIIENNVKSSTDFVDMIGKFGELGYVDSTSSPWGYEIVMESVGFYNAYLEWKNQVTEEDLEVKYNEGYAQGEIDGVTEYKESEEYATILDSKYSTGYTEGMESFKESEAYANALQVQYATGKTDGVTEFKKSVAFKNTLKGEYDNGYDAGVADTEGQAVKNEFTKVLSIFIGVMGFGIILMSVLGVMSKFKKKAKRR